MKRKVVKLGPSTLVVSLPSKWLKQFNVNAGEELELTEEGASIRIATKNETHIQKKFLDLTGKSLLLKRILVSKYLEGCDEVEVKVDSLEKARMLQRRIDELIGVEITDQGKNTFTFKDFGSVNEEVFETVLRRVLYLLHSMADESLKAIKNEETDLEYLKDIEKNINKFTDYSFRLLNKKHNVSNAKTPVMYCIVFLLEELADSYKKFLSYISDNAMALPDDFIQMYNAIVGYHHAFEKAFMDFSYEKAIALAGERDKMIARISGMRKKTQNKDLLSVLHSFDAITETIIKILGQMLTLH